MRRWFKYKIFISEFQTSSQVIEYTVKGDDIEITETDGDFPNLNIMLGGKIVFTCSMCVIMECYREDTLLDRKVTSKANLVKLKGQVSSLLPLKKPT